MTQDDILKLKAAALYILKRCGECDFIHLFKTLYFAERQHYAYYGQHLVKDTFCAMPKGPVPSFLYDAVKLACGSKVCAQDSPLHIVASALKHGSGECQYFYVNAAEEPDMDELSRADIVSLDKAIEFCRSKDSDTLSSLSHDEAWHAAFQKKPSSTMDSLLIAKAGGANDDFIDYLDRQLAVDKYLVG